MMDLRSQMKVVDLLLKLFRGDLQHINPYPFVPQKHKNIPNADSGGLMRSIPEHEGIQAPISSAFLKSWMPAHPSMCTARWCSAMGRSSRRGAGSRIPAAIRI